ncbi:protein CTLA-2-alpha-like isoform X2 [Clarias gariepinus]|uniref:protein CTLA-2-alpha-like isoform X2 n=1 Tax=Clarias gariepinus TaxID=13013 RepID=UPI00234D6A9C|nr:protein CTLA-2-alpha-like isoform X2 [Clarias gariepinus]
MCVKQFQTTYKTLHATKATLKLLLSSLQGSMLKSWLVLVLLLASAVSRPLDSSLDASWKKWKHTFGKEYKSPAEEAFRRGIWEKTLRYIERHNREYEQGLHTFTVGLNQFADMRPGEIC